VKRRKSKNRVKISFAATILVLVGITVVAYSLSFRVPSYSIPSTLPRYGGLIGSYAPADSLQVTFGNLSAIRAYNSSAVPNTQLVNLVKPSVTIHFNAVQAQVFVTILNPALNINNTATVAVLSGGAYANLSRALAASSLVPVQEQGFAIYRVNDSSNGRTKTEWLTLNQAGSSVLFAEGGADAEAVMLKMISVWQGTLPSILTVQNVTRLLYPVSGTTHLAFAIQNFTGEVLSSRMGVVAVDVANQQVTLTHVVHFSSASVASSQVGEVQAVYRFATDFSLWEENVKAVQTFSMTNLQGAVALAGG
jgi:hypothetical protein